MKDFFKHLGRELFIVIILFCICLSVFALVYDDYGSFAYMSLPAKQYSDFIHIDHCYNSFIGISFIYEFLYHLLPSYNWMGIAFMLQTLLSIYLILKILRWHILLKVSNKYVVWVVQLLFALLFIDNIVTLSHTRFSLLFCGIALFNLAFTQKLSVWDWILNSVLFLMGTLNRPESSIGMLALAGIGALIYSFEFKRWFIRFLFPALTTITLFSAVAYDWNHTDTYVKKIEPEIEYKMMDKRVVALDHMKTKIDTVKYEAAIIGMWFDTKKMNPTYLRSLQLSGMNLSVSHSLDVLTHVCSLYQFYALIPCIVLILITACLFTFGGKRPTFQVVFFQFSTFVLLFALDYNGKLVAGRHFLNIQIVGLLFTLFYVFDKIDNKQLQNIRRLPLAITVTIILSGAFITLNNVYTTNWSTADQIKNAEHALKEFESTYSNRLVVVNVSTYSLFDHRLTIQNKRYLKNRYIMFDFFNYSLSPKYQSYLNKECQCNNQDPAAFFKWLANQKALYISKSYRLDLTQKYMEVVCHFPLRFKPVRIFKTDNTSNSEIQPFDVAEVEVSM